MTTPLSERVDAPAELVPAPVDGISWRAASLDDLDGLVTLFGTMARVDHPAWAESRDELREELSHSWVDPSRDTLVGVAESDGSFVAAAEVMATPDPETIARSILFGGVHPEWRGRGIGRALLAWQEGRARQQLAASHLDLPGWIMAYSQERNEGAARLFERAGFATERYFSQLERDLSDPIPELEVPEGLEFVNLSHGLSEATRVAKNDAFRDHWSSQPFSPEQWDSAMELTTRRIDLSFLARDAGRIVGFVVVDVNEDDWQLQGFRGAYIGLVGVVRDWRRRGVAPALLAASLTAMKDAGLERAVLDVDSANPTGALSLYSGMGFAKTSGSRAHVKAF